MGVSPDEVDRDVEGMEHHLSKSSLRVIEVLLEELSENRELLEKVRSATITL